MWDLSYRMYIPNIYIFEKHSTRGAIDELAELGIIRLLLKVKV